MLLFINACVRENSRTERLAKCLLEKLDQRFTEVRLEAISFPVTNEAYLTRRDQLIEAGDFSDPSFSLAHQFASARFFGSFFFTGSPVCISGSDRDRGTLLGPVFPGCLEAVL